MAPPTTTQDRLVQCGSLLHTSAPRGAANITPSPPHSASVFTQPQHKKPKTLPAPHSIGGVGMARQVNRHENCCLEELHRSPSQMPRPVPPQDSLPFLRTNPRNIGASIQPRIVVLATSAPSLGTATYSLDKRGGDIRRLSNVTV